MDAHDRLIQRLRRARLYAIASIVLACISLIATTISLIARYCH